MFYVVSYDISNDRLRDRVSKALAALGTRVQKSVFELDLPAEQIAQVISKVATLIESTDSLRCYRICERCLADLNSFPRHASLYTIVPSVMMSVITRYESTTKLIL